MKSATITVLLVLLLNAGMCLAQDTLWMRYLSIGDMPQVASVRCQGTEVYLAGMAFDTSTQYSDAFAARYTGAGTPVWTKPVDLDSFEGCAGLAVGPDQSPYLGMVTGRMEPTTVLVKLDSSGDTLWTRSRTNALPGPLVTDDGNNVYVLGAAGDPVPEESLSLTRYTAGGTQTWSTTLRLGMMHQPTGLCRTSGGDLVAAVTLMDTMRATAALVKFSASSGETLWTRQFSESLAMDIMGIAAAGSDSLFLLAYNIEGPCLQKTGPNGDTAWTVPLSWQMGLTPDLATDLSGNVFLAYSDDDMDFKVDKYGPGGAFLGTGRAGSPDQDIPMSLAVGTDGYPVVTGMAFDTLGGMRVLTVKFSDTPGGIAGEFTGRSLQFAVFPNPIASGFATLRIPRVKESGGGRVACLRVFDVTGRCVLVRQLVTGNWELVTPLDLRNVSAGVYLVRLDAGSGSATRKLVVARE